MGSAGLRGARDDGLESMASIGDAYTAEMDARNQTALEVYKAQMKALGKKKGGSGAAVERRSHRQR